MTVNFPVDHFVHLHQTLAQQEFQKGLALEKSARKMIDMRAVDRRFLAQMLFPLSSLMSYQKNDEKLYCNQVRALYHHCRKYNKADDEFSYSPVQTTVLDLKEKNVRWAGCPNWDTANIMHVAALKITHFVHREQGLKTHKQKWEFQLKTGMESFHLFGKNMIPEKYFCIELFDGNQMELSFPEESSSIIDPKFWDEWKISNSLAADTYRTRIYPCFIHAVKKISFIYFPKPIRILDIGGGDGELSMELAKLPQVGSITLIDNNGPSTQLATRRVKCGCPFSKPEIRSKIDVIAGDITKQETFDPFDESFDLIILSGVVAQQVLMRKESSELLRWCHSLLSREGYVLIGSHSHPHFKASDYEAMSYDVLNKTASMKQENKTEVEPFYILQKA